MLAYKIQTPGNFPEENIQRKEHGESLKSRITCLVYPLFYEVLVTELVQLIKTAYDKNPSL
jgi:hypothetical protein